MTVVSDTSPITNLAAIGKLDLLAQVFGSVLVPDAVAAELLRGSEGAPGRVDVAKLDWVSVRQVGNQALVVSLALELDEGEAEAIALARQTNTDCILMDERRGRHAARKLGLKPLGLLGVLVLAKRGGLLAEVKPVLDSLIADAGFWIGRDLYEHVLSEVSET